MVNDIEGSGTDGFPNPVDPEVGNTASTTSGTPTVKRGYKGYRRAPRSLQFAVLVAMLMSAMYFFRIFQYMPTAVQSKDVATVLWTFVMMLLFFGMFVRFVIYLFRLPSGSRRAWAGTVRMAISYVALTVLGELGVLQIASTTVDLNIIQISPWIMSGVMLLLMVYMFMKPIRDFFTPTYADRVGGTSWLKYVFWIDPFDGKRMIV
ncbi:MAG: hypothetical protein WC067_03700 [Candidatus Methanomethylophilaceae archaeon]